MVSKENNLFIINTDYQFTLANAAIYEFYHLQNNVILFFYRKSDYIRQLKKMSLPFEIHLFDASEKYNLRYLSGLINEIKRIFNFWRSIHGLKNRKFDNIFISQEEQHFLAVIPKCSTINSKIIHLEEGNAINNNGLINETTNSIQNSSLKNWLKKIRDKGRLFYFGQNILESPNNYGRAEYYDAALILNEMNLIPELNNKRQLLLSKRLYISSLDIIFNFTSELITHMESEEWVVLVVTDGEEEKTPFSRELYISIVHQIYSLSKNKGYKVYIKKHPIDSGYLDGLSKEIQLIQENFPSEYYFSKMKNLLVVGGSSTSLAISKLMGIETYSYLELYLKNDTMFNSSLLSLLDYLNSIGVKQISKFEDIFS